MFNKLVEINSRPEPFEFYTAEELWNDEYSSKKMLEFHLNESVDLSSRNRDFIARSAKWIVSYFGVGSNFKIADFGCGPGLYTTLFAENNADVTGIDFSKRSIVYAENQANEKGLDIAYYNENYLAFETRKKFDLITMIFCDFCALSPSQRKVLLNKFSGFLKPGGSLLLDVYSLNPFNSLVESSTYELNQMDNFWSSEDYYGFLNTFKYDKEKVSLDKYTVIEKERARVIYNWLQYFSLDSITKEIEDSGLEVKEFFSDVSGAPFSQDSSEIAITAVKPDKG